MPKKILVIGSINKDLVVNTTRFPLDGETLIGASFYTNNGGKGANQALAISKLGGDVSIIAAVGDDSFGRENINTLSFHKVETDNIIVKKLASTGIASITVTNDGANNIIVVPGANFLLSREDIDDNVEIIEDSDIVVIQLEIPIETAEFAAILSKELGKIIILNPSPAVYLSDDFLSSVDILIPNENEINIIGGVERALSLGVKNVIVTLGKYGCDLFTKEYKKHFNAYNVKVVDTTAAGDSFLGAFTRMLSLNKTIEESIKFGVKVSNITVTRKGAVDSIPTFDEVTTIDFENIKE